MAGRNRMPRHPLNGPRGFPPGPAPIPFHPAHRIEEEMEMQIDEIRMLSGENRRLAESLVDLRHDLGAATDEVHRLNQIIADIQMDKDRQTRELVDKCMRLEAELLAIEPLKNELHQLHADLQKLSAQRQELTSQVQVLSQDLTRAQSDVQQVPALKKEMDSIHQELVRTRSALEYEKKANAEQYEQRQTMEKNLVSMAREVERLRAGLTNAEKRDWATANPSGAYGSKLAGAAGYSGAYAEAYGMHPASAVAVEKGSRYGPAADSWAAYDKQRPRR